MILLRYLRLSPKQRQTLMITMGLLILSACYIPRYLLEIETLSSQKSSLLQQKNLFLSQEKMIRQLEKSRAHLKTLQQQLAGPSLKDFSMALAHELELVDLGEEPLDNETRALHFKSTAPNLLEFLKKASQAKASLKLLQLDISEDPQSTLLTSELHLQEIQKPLSPENPTIPMHLIGILNQADLWTAIFLSADQKLLRFKLGDTLPNTDQKIIAINSKQISLQDIKNKSISLQLLHPKENI